MTAGDTGDPLTTLDNGRHTPSIPGWLANLTALSWRVIAIVAFVVVLGYLGTLIWNILASIGLTIIVAAILAPLVLRMRATGRSRGSAAGIAWIVAIGAALGLAALLALALWPFLSDLLGWLEQGRSEVETVVAEAQLPTWLSTLTADVIDNAEAIGGDAVSRIAGSVANLVGILVLATFLLYFFLRDGDKAWLWLFQSMPEDKREHISTAGDEALERVSSYARGTTVIAVAAAVSSFGFMLVLGTPLALALALLTFALAYVPYFGGFIAGLIVILVTWAAVDGTAALVMAMLLLGRYLLVERYVRPRALKGTWTIHPVAVLIVLPLGFHIGGVAGLILAVPLAAAVLSVAQAGIDILRPETSEHLPELVPGWLDRVAQWSWRGVVVLAFAALLILVLTAIPLVLMPVILALLLAATVMPLVEALVRRGLARTPATAVAVGGTTLAIVGVLALSLVSVVRQANELGGTATLGVEAIDDAAGGYLAPAAEAIGSGIDSGLATILSLVDSLAAMGAVLALAVLLTFYFLRDGSGLWQTMVSRLPSQAGAELSEAGRRAFSVLGGYMLGTGAISFVGAASQAVIMWVLGLPLVMPVFVLSLFGGYIPYIGSLLTTGLALLIAVAVGDAIDVVVMLIWTLAFNIVQGNIVAPLVYNRTTAIHPAIVLAAIPAGSAVAGILGMFLVVPALGVVGTTWRSVLRILSADEDQPAEPSAPGDDEAEGAVPETPAAEPSLGPIDPHLADGRSS